MVINVDEVGEGRALPLTFIFFKLVFIYVFKEQSINYKTFPTQMRLMDLLTSYPALQNFNFSQMPVRLPPYLSLKTFPVPPCTEAISN